MRSLSGIISAGVYNVFIPKGLLHGGNFGESLKTASSR